MNKDNKNEEEEHVNSSAGNFSLGINIISSILVGMAMGYGLDRLLDTAPIFMITFIFLGFAAGIRTVWQELERQSEDDK